jgi:hypothetical protein
MLAMCALPVQSTSQTPSGAIGSKVSHQDEKDLNFEPVEVFSTRTEQNGIAKRCVDFSIATPGGKKT